MLLDASPAAANAGIPMLVLVWPASWVLFIPIVLVEGRVAQRVLEVPFKQGAKLALVANAWSTLVGIPLAWLGMLMVEYAIGFSLYALKSEPGPAMEFLLSLLMAAWISGMASWQIPAAGAVLCAPFFFASVWVEARVARRRFAPDLALRWARSANVATYGPIMLGLAAYALYVHFYPTPFDPGR